MNTKKLKQLLSDETIDSLDYNLKKNLPNFPLKALLMLQWNVIYEALTEE